MSQVTSCATKVHVFDKTLVFSTCLWASHSKGREWWQLVGNSLSRNTSVKEPPPYNPPSLKAPSVPTYWRLGQIKERKMVSKEQWLRAEHRYSAPILQLTSRAVFTLLGSATRHSISIASSGRTANTVTNFQSLLQNEGEVNGERRCCFVYIFGSFLSLGQEKDRKTFSVKLTISRFTGGEEGKTIRKSTIRPPAGDAEFLAGEVETMPRNRR